MQSVALQTLKPDLYLVVDSSEEATKPQMKAICSETGAQYGCTPPHGIYTAVNQALRLVLENSYVWFINSSDWPSCSESMARLWQAITAGDTPKTAWVVGGLFRGNAGDLSLHSIGPDAERFIRRLKIGATGFPHPSVVIPAKAILSIGGFDERYRIAADYDLGLRVVQGLALPRLLEFPVAQHVPGGISLSQPFRNFFEKLQARVRHLPLPEAILGIAVSIVYGMRRALRRMGMLTEPKPTKDYSAVFDDPWQHFCGHRNKAWPSCCKTFWDTGFVGSYGTKH